MQDFINIGINRLNSFKILEEDNLEILLNRYINNIKLSESLYPALSILEISLRNSLNYAIERHILNEWLLKELDGQKILTDKTYLKLKKAYNNVIDRYGKLGVTKGRLISELSFGFWVRLCTKEYNPTIWTQKGVFYETFPNFPKSQAAHIHSISKKLNSILKLRNRIFHHEPILKNLKAVETRYYEIIEILSYMQCNTHKILNKTCRFKQVYSEILKNQKPRALYAEEASVGRNL